MFGRLNPGRLPFLGLALAPCVLGGAEDASVATCSRDKESPAAAVGVARICFPDGALAHGVAAISQPSGQAVGARVLWSAPGEPATILFDASGNAASYAFRGAASEAAWEARAGVTIEARRRVDGPADTWEQALALWNHCTEVEGRALVANVFHGINPCGETRDYGAEYHGWFQVAKAGDYRFSTLSDDASFIAIDGKVLVQWGSPHGLDGGQHGQHGANITLQAGPHQVQYLYFQFGDNPIVELAWQPPGEKQPSVMPASAFIPIAQYHVDAMTWPGERPWFSWEMAGNAIAGGQSLIEVALTAHLPKGATKAVWSFDDGGTAEGLTPHHCFARGGTREVRLETFAGAAKLEPCARTISVHPLWTQLEEWSDGAHNRMRGDLGKRDVQRMPAADVLALVRYAAFIGDGGWITDIGKGVLADAKHWGAGGAELLGELGFQLQDPDVRQYAPAADAWRAFLSLVPDHTPAREHAALHCGGLLIHCLDLPDEALAILGSIDPKKLEREEPRLLALYLGDGALAKGNIDGARAKYAEAGDVVKPGDLGYAVRRRTRLEAAKDYCARGEHEQALQVLREIEWETPAERLGTETGLLKVRAHLGRKELQFALACCKHMLVAVGPDEHRADVLFALVQTELACKDRAAAIEAARVLVKDHPYSEAAAKAKDAVPEAAHR